MMRENRTPLTAIFDPLCACFEVIQDAQKADVLFVSVRLYPPGFIGVAARIAAIVLLYLCHSFCIREGNGCFPSVVQRSSWGHLCEP
jgi:hypothetical protein